MKWIVFSVFSLLTLAMNAQPGKVVDRIIGVVGNEIILQSDLESSVLEMTEGRGSDDATLRCSVYENLLYQKLLLNQAKLDSIEVSDDELIISFRCLVAWRNLKSTTGSLRRS
jgi:peptidyl-prolyl cis-trans isomerase SurA